MTIEAVSGQIPQPRDPVEEQIGTNDKDVQIQSDDDGFKLKDPPGIVSVATDPGDEDLRCNRNGLDNVGGDGVTVARKQDDIIPNSGHNDYSNDEDTTTTVSSITVLNDSEHKRTPSLGTFAMQPKSTDRSVAEETSHVFSSIREEMEDRDWFKNSLPKSPSQSPIDLDFTNVPATTMQDNSISDKLGTRRVIQENDVSLMGGSATMIYHNNKNTTGAANSLDTCDNGVTNHSNFDLAPWKVAAISDIANQKFRSVAVDPPSIEQDGKQEEPSKTINLDHKLVTLSTFQEAVENRTSRKQQQQQDKRPSTNDVELGSRKVNTTDSSALVQSTSEVAAGSVSPSANGLIHRIFRRIINSAASTGILQLRTPTTTNPTVITKTTLRNDPSKETATANFSSGPLELPPFHEDARKRVQGEFDVLNLEDDNISSTHDETTGTYLDQSHQRHRSTNLHYTDDDDDDESNYNIAVAEPVQIHETFLPAAIECDTEHKYNPADNEHTELKHRRQRFLQFGVVVVFLSTIIGTSVGISRHRNDSNLNATSSNSTVSYLAERENVGIYEMITQNIPGTEGILQTDAQHAYTKAYRWIMYNDPLRTIPMEYPQFLQRYVLATLYYATSQEAPWSVCTPPPSTLSLPVLSGTNNSSNATEIDNDDYTSDCTVSAQFARDIKDSKELNHWFTGVNECQWTGIVCDAGQNVERINIADMGLSGTIPDSLAQFPLIQYIEFSSVKGNLIGTIPEIGSKCLRYFGVRNNFLSGRIPSSLIRGRSIQTLRLSGNQLTGNLEGFKRFNRDLLLLDINNNKMAQSSMKYVTRLQSLSRLLIGSNQFTGTIPTELLSFHYLLALDVSNNLITGTIPDPSPSLPLMLLDVSNNQLTGTIPTNIYNLTLLQELLLNNNYLNGTLSSDIQYLVNLNTLRLDHNPNLEGTIPTDIGTLIAISKALFLDTSFTGQIPTELCSLRSGALNAVTADCYDDSFSTRTTPEITCPDGCCTICCNLNGTSCVNM